MVWPPIFPVGTGTDRRRKPGGCPQEGCRQFHGGRGGGSQRSGFRAGRNLPGETEEVGPSSYDRVARNIPTVNY